MEGYEVLHVIGSGSFGKVFMGRNKATNETVALKKISKGGRQKREILSLRQECDIQKNLHHPHIIQMLDSFETEDSVVVVTEYAQGDLSKLMISIGKLPEEKVQPIARHLVSALYFLHSHRILHRDIKPQNILIGWDGNCKLCDFGFAKTMDINTYMLTSVKGTPLYMSPEILKEKPYDHNADLWSLGCILYELLVGIPPFFTASLFQLVRKIKNEEIMWPEDISADCLSFLQGLLEKDPQKRLTWPALLSHPFVRDGLYVDKTVAEFSLTKALSPSQELAKEKQRQNLQRKLAGYSKLLVKTAKKLEEAQKELKRCSEDEKVGHAKVKTPLPSPNSRPPVASTMPLKPVQPGIGVPPQDPLNFSPNLYSALPDDRNLKVMFQNLNLKEARLQKQPLDVRLNDEEDRMSGASSCETMTSSSEFETDESDEVDDDANTVIVENRKKREHRKKGSSDKSERTKDSLEFLDDDKIDKPCGRGGSDLLWKSGALFTLHSFGSEDKEINRDEWIYFLMNTMKEVLDNPKSLCEKHFLTMLVAPLRNHLAESEVVERIARLLSIPFTLDKCIHEKEPGLMSTLQTLYLDTKVLPNLLYACKLIVRRRRVGIGSVTMEEIPSVLTVEDLEGLEKCLRLVAFLVHIDEDYVTQLCDSVCVLQAFAILQLFIKLDAMRPDLTANTIAILCQIMRTFPSNKSIVEEIFMDEGDSNPEDAHSELWRLLTHSNYAIQCRSIRVFTYLCLHSETVKTDFLGLRRTKVWKILRRATISPHTELREAAEFALQALNYKPNSTTTVKSNSTSSNSGCRAIGSQVAGSISAALVSSASGDETQDDNREQSGSLRQLCGKQSHPVESHAYEGVNADEASNESSR